MTKHTPGPWILEGHWSPDSKKLGGWVSTAHPSPLFALEPITGTPANIIANARLIAAAPDLLAFVRDVARLDPIFAKGHEKRRIHDARALVGKAEGKP